MLALATALWTQALSGSMQVMKKCSSQVRATWSKVFGRNGGTVFILLDVVESYGLTGSTCCAASLARFKPSICGQQCREPFVSFLLSPPKRCFSIHCFLCKLSVKYFRTKVRVTMPIKSPCTFKKDVLVVHYSRWPIIRDMLRNKF